MDGRRYGTITEQDYLFHGLLWLRRSLSQGFLQAERARRNGPAFLPSPELLDSRSVFENR